LGRASIASIACGALRSKAQRPHNRTACRNARNRRAVRVELGVLLFAEGPGAPACGAMGQFRLARTG